MNRYSQLLRTPRRAATRTRLLPRKGQVQKRFESSSSSSSASKEKADAFIEERKAVKEHAAKTADLWRKLSLYVVPPALLISFINAWNLWSEHWEHWDHLPPLEDRPQYPYMNVRAKAFPWGDGDKTLFWNDKVNYHRRD